MEEEWYANEIAARLAKRTTKTFEELKAKWRWSAGKARGREERRDGGMKVSSWSVSTSSPQTHPPSLPPSLPPSPSSPPAGPGPSHHSQPGRLLGFLPPHADRGGLRLPRHPRRQERRQAVRLPPSLPPSPPILRSSSFLTLPPFLPPRFADGEVFIRILQEIRGRDCFVIIPTNSNDK